MANYLSDKSGVEIDAALDKAAISIGTDNTGIKSNGSLEIEDVELNSAAGGAILNIVTASAVDGYVIMTDNNGAVQKAVTSWDSAGARFENPSNNNGISFKNDNDTIIDGNTIEINALDLGGQRMTGAATGVSIVSASTTEGKLTLSDLFSSSSAFAQMGFDTTGSFFGNVASFDTSSNVKFELDGTAVFDVTKMEVDIINMLGFPAANGVKAITIGRSGTADSTIVIGQNANDVKVAMDFRNDNGTVGTISTSGAATSYNVSSDERLKDNFAPISDAFELVKAIVESDAVQYFNFKSDPSVKVPGFVAQRLISCGAGGMVTEGKGSTDLNVEIGSIYEPAVTEQVEIMRGVAVMADVEMTKQVTVLNADGEPEALTIGTGEFKSVPTGKVNPVGTGEFKTEIIEPEKVVTPCGVDQSKAVPHLVQLCYDQQIQINALIARLDAANI